MSTDNRWLTVVDQVTRRCWWPGEHDDYIEYHDDEWGRPTGDDIRLFEKICLEGFQSGLSWLTILRKRNNFRSAFAGFDFEEVADFDEADVERLVQDAGIVRHRRKIESTSTISMLGSVSSGSRSCRRLKARSSRVKSAERCAAVQIASTLFLTSP